MKHQNVKGHFSVLEELWNQRVRIVRECQNAPIIDNYLYSKSYFSNTSCLIFSNQVATELFVILEQYLVKNLSNPFLHWKVDGSQTPELFCIMGST